MYRRVADYLQVPVVQNSSSSVQPPTIHSSSNLAKLPIRPGLHNQEPQNLRTGQVCVFFFNTYRKTNFSLILCNNTGIFSFIFIFF